MRREMLKMLFGAVPFVGEKIVMRILSVVLGHQSIPRHFRDNRGCRDRHAKHVAFDDRADRERASRKGNCVNKEAIRLGSEPSQSATHCQASGFKDVQLIDFCLAGRTDADTDGTAGNRLIKFFTLGFCQKLGIITANQTAPAGQDDRRRHDRARQRAATGFIQPGDPPIPAAPGFEFKHFEMAPEDWEPQ